MRKTTYASMISDTSIRLFDSLSTNNEKSWQQSMEWNQHCLQHHSRCKPGYVSREEWPTRVLDVGYAESSSLRLRETSELSVTSLKYTSLSHCWGGQLPLRLVADNYTEFLNDIALEDMPKSFRDAVEVTRKLGIQYLWIDALCIIQDSTLDWSRESGRMNMVYRNSYLTIAAAAARNATVGIHSARNPLSVVPCCIPCEDGDKTSFAWSEYKPEEQEREETERLVLFSRAWVLQERLLSSRSLIFGKKELYWECLEHQGSEMYPGGDRSFYVAHRDSQEKKIFNLRRFWRNMDREPRLSLWKFWNAMVSQYSALKLSHSLDKLVAIAGLAADFHAISPEAKYLAGIWSYQFRRALLWQSNRGVDAQSDSCYIAPSWSWASVDGVIRWESIFSDGIAEVLDVRITLTSQANPYGAVTSGYLRLRAPIIRLELERVAVKPSWHIKAITSASHPLSSRNSEDHNSETNFEIASEIENVPGNRLIEVELTLDKLGPRDPHPQLNKEKLPVEHLDAFFVPLEVAPINQMQLHLEGLIVMTTGSVHGQFRRIGYFSVCSPAVFNLFTDDSHDASETPESKEYNDWFEKKKATAALDIYSEDDPYCNGIIDKTLYRRYGRWGTALTNIDSFLNLVSERMQAELDSGQLDESLYEEVDPDGYKVFHII